MKNLAICLSGMILPGTGHVVLGKWQRGIAFLVLLSVLFFVGVSLERDFYTKFGPNVFGLDVQHPARMIPPEGPPDEEGMLDMVWKFVFIYLYPFFVGIVNYVLGYHWTLASSSLVVSLPFVETIHTIPVTVRDIGYCFALLAGLLNLLVMMDAYDIACNMDELDRRQAAGKEEG